MKLRAFLVGTVDTFNIYRYHIDVVKQTSLYLTQKNILLTAIVKFYVFLMGVLRLRSENEGERIIFVITSKVIDQKRL